MIKKLNLGFLASGGGSNVQAIIDSIKTGKLDAEPKVVISNNSNAGVLHRAEKEGLFHYHISSKTNPDDLPQAIINAFKLHDVNTIILAGYMKIIPHEIIKAFSGRVLNIHPALLPKFGGKGMYGINVHKAVIDAKEKVSGATVHLVNQNYDEGQILMQKEVPVFDDDSPESLAQRVLNAEHVLYSKVLQELANGNIAI